MKSLKQPKKEALTLSKKEIDRPWQGTIFAFLNFFYLITQAIAILFSIGLLVWAICISQSSDPMDNDNFGMGIMVIFLISALVIFIPLFILQWYVTKGIFKGQRWTIMVTLIFTLLNVPGVLIGSFLKDGYGIILSLALMILLAFLLYLEIILLRHPFFYKND